MCSCSIDGTCRLWRIEVRESVVVVDVISCFLFDAATLSPPPPLHFFNSDSATSHSSNSNSATSNSSDSNSTSSISSTHSPPQSENFGWCCRFLYDEAISNAGPCPSLVESKTSSELSVPTVIVATQRELFLVHRDRLLHSLCNATGHSNSFLHHLFNDSYRDHFGRIFHLECLEGTLHVSRRLWARVPRFSH